MPTDEHTEDEHDKALKDSFPASDPPASSGITGAGPTDTPAGERTTAEPTGHPTSDRHGAETAAQKEDEKAPGSKA